MNDLHWHLTLNYGLPHCSLNQNKSNLLSFHLISLHKKLDIIPMLNIQVSGIVFLLTKHTNTTLKFLGKAIWNDIWATSEQDPTDFYSNPSRKWLNHNMEHPYAIIWFSEVICLRFHVTDFIGRRSNLNSRYWLLTDDFFNNTGKNTEKVITGMCQLYFFIRVHHWQPLLQIYID